MKPIPILLSLLLFLPLPGFSQDSPESGAAADPPPAVQGEASAEAATARARTVASLRAQLEAIRIKRGNVEELEAQLDAETNEVSREAAVEKLEKETRELNGLLLEFRESAAGVDIGLFEEKPSEPFSWQQKLGELLEPILAALEEATATSRRIADLREEAETFGERAEAASTAAARVEDLLAAAGDPALVEALEEQLGTWRERENLARSRMESARLQLENLEEQQEGVLGGTTRFIRDFVQQRGLNLLLGVGAALAVFFAVRLVLAVARRFRKTENPRNFGSRVFVVTANLLSVLGAVAAMLAAFSVTGDVFLFSFVLLFLLGVAWGGVKVLPQFVESLKLILNIGMVKEGERIVFDGVPWQVESLGFKSRLRNRRLGDAVQILPVRELVGHHSRPWCEGETEFPCEAGDWVQLSDGRVGRVAIQNPGQVVLEELGGAPVTFPTPDFLELAPRNLSAASFRVETRFGVDYRHQGESTGPIPADMERAVREGVSALVGADAVRSARVRFAAAGPSSLDYEVEVDLDGSVAPEHETVRYALQRILVDRCNENGWVIPFQQLTIHRAGPASG
jgi:hypothetical protein